MTLADARAKGAMVVYTGFGIFALVRHGNFGSRSH